MRLCEAAIAGNNIPEIQAAFDLAPYDVRVWQAVGAEAQALLCQLGGAHSSLALPVPEAVVAEPADLAPSALVSPAAVFALHAGGGGAVLVTPVRRRPRGWRSLRARVPPGLERLPETAVRPPR